LKIFSAAKTAKLLQSSQERSTENLN